MSNTIRIEAELLRARLSESLAEAGAAPASVEAATRAMMHASRIGVDSHGARLVGYYRALLQDGRVNRTPRLAVRRTGPATGLVDGDEGLGHLASYRAMEEALTLAREAGIGAVGAVRSSHFGAAGAYAVEAAEAGFIGLATANADSLVTLFDGAEPFHGTNPLAIAAPVAGEPPWLLDMATSSIPFNRVLLFRSLGAELPADTAADRDGRPTRDAEAASMLMPLGGVDFGFKGAALAGLATLLSAVLLGATLDHDLPAFEGRQAEAPRASLGHFFIAIDPARFGGRPAFEAGMRRYLEALRRVPSRPGGGPVMAPGDREWRVMAERRQHGIPIDLDTASILGLGGETRG